MLNKIEVLEKITWNDVLLKTQSEECEFVKRRCPRVDDDGASPKEDPNNNDVVECVNIYRVIGADFNQVTKNGPTQTTIRFSCESRESSSGGGVDGPCREPPNNPNITIFRASNCLENNENENNENLEGCFKFCVVVK